MRFPDMFIMKCLTCMFGSHDYTTHQRRIQGRFGKLPLSNLLALYIGALMVILSACDANPGVPATLNKRTPTVSTAAGEPILPHSQIFLHDAPLPTAADLRFDSRNWTLAGFDNAATRFVSLPACCDAHPAPLWYQSLGAPVLESPVINNGLIYLVASDGYLHVLSTQNGAEQWRVPVGGELTADGLALSNGLIYLARDGHYIAALDVTNGQERWRFDTVGVVRGTPLVVGHDLLVSSGANTLFCLDALTGQEYWAFHSEDTLAQYWPTRGAPAVADNLVYVALGASTEFNALSLRTGRKVWEVNLHERMTGGPLLDTALGMVYVVTWSGKMLALDMHTGSTRWEIQLASGSQSSPALDEQSGTLYIGDYTGILSGLDAATGEMRWRVAMGSSIDAAPLVVRTTTQTWLVIAAQGGVCALLDARTGKQFASWKPGELRASPVVAQGILYQASLGDQGLFAFRL